MANIMNDKIKELSEQAKNTMQVIGDMEVDLIEYTHTLGELIVNEATNIIYQHMSPCDADGLEERAVTIGMDISINILNDFFGVTNGSQNRKY